VTVALFLKWLGLEIYAAHAWFRPRARYYPNVIFWSTDGFYMCGPRGISKI
jgi:hypothetical protein